MVKIINGKKYNTETSTKIYTFSKPTENYTQELFKTKAGRWFKVEYKGSQQRLFTVKPTEALHWLQNHGAFEEIQQYC